MDIPEDDPRNPAVIADNVGVSATDAYFTLEVYLPVDDMTCSLISFPCPQDNVGDVAGMGADLFESFVSFSCKSGDVYCHLCDLVAHTIVRAFYVAQVGSIIAAVTLAKGDVALVMLPFWVAGAGILASMVAFFFVGTKDGANQKELMFALHKGTIVSSTLVVAFSAVICNFLFQDREDYGWRVFSCICIGLFAGVMIGQVTEFFTSYSYWPTQSITDAGVTGPATVIIQGLGIGMISTLFPTIIIVATILGCNGLASEYGISMAAVGMLSTLGVTLATDAYGPVADNAGGIAEMAELEESVRDTTDALDALGNTTAATGKGFAIGSAVLTALSLLSAFSEKAGLKENGVTVGIGEPTVLSGVLIGAMLVSAGAACHYKVLDNLEPFLTLFKPLSSLLYPQPFLFAALTMLSVQKAAGAIIIEVRRQFAEIPGLREGTAEADSDKCVAISTQSSVEEMILPGLYAILAPITVGFLIGPRCLVGMLGGAIASGMMLAIMMANAGGAWDNSKKYIEIEGAKGGKGTETHKACVVGDTVGDPFKDTSGPALNILIKLMSIISLTVAPLMDTHNKDWDVWYYGLIPLGVMLIGTYMVYELFWRNTQDIEAPVSVDNSKKEVAEPEKEEAGTA